MKVMGRFLSKVAINYDTGCWDWLGSLDGTGYGQFCPNGKTMQAHRFIFIQTYGEIKDGFELDHLCRNRRCVNPKHLEMVTHKENVNRGLMREVQRQHKLNRTHCGHGHPYDSDNTYIKPNGQRDCRTCQKIRFANFIKKKGVVCLK